MEVQLTRLRRRLSGAAGQGLVEFALTLPIMLVVAFGVIEVGYVLLDQHVVTKLAREGSNLISRDTSIEDAVTAMKSMSTRPVDFNIDAKVIFSVIMKVPTVGATNFNREVLRQRHEYGNLVGVQSTLKTAGNGAFRGAPDYEAVNSDNDANLQIINLPANLTVPLGGLIYVTEVYTKHPLITPFDKWGITVPTTLYSIAYF
jgi:Flp pilus assembly protein TadG